MRLRAALRALSGAFACGALACGPSTGSGPAASTEAGRAGDLAAAVAVVDGEPITAGQVAQLAARDGLAPTDALRALERYVLLAHEAERRGLARTSAVRLAERRALAQLVLRDMERAVGPEQVTDAALEVAFEAERGALAEPERRLVAWVRVEPRLGVELTDEARTLAGELLARMAREGLGPVLVEYGEAPPESARHRFSVEEGAVVEPDPSGASVLRRAFFEPAGPGALAEPIVTPRGVYAAYVIDVLPPHAPSRAQVEPTLRATALVRLRADAVGALLDEARARTPVRFDEAALAPVLDVGAVGPGGAL